MPLNPRSQMSIDSFNEQLRANPQYQAFLRSMGIDPSRPIRLNDRQRDQAAAWVRQHFGGIGNLQIDPAGNVNQDEGFSRHAKWIVPAAIGAATLGFGAAGMGPAAGLFGGGGAGAGAGAAGAGAGLLPSSSIPTSLAMNAVPGIGSTIGGGVAGAMSGAGALGGGLGSLMPGAATGAAASQGLGSRILESLMSPGGLATAGTIAAALANRGDGQNDRTRASEDQARRLQAITEARMRRVDPLHEAVTQLAFGRLPVSSRQGIGLPRVALPE